MRCLTADSLCVLELDLVQMGVAVGGQRFSAQPWKGSASLLPSPPNMGNLWTWLAVAE